MVARTAAAPLIKPSLLRNRGFTAGLVMGVVFFAAVAGLVYAVSLFLQRGLGDSPLRAAATGFAPMAAGIVVASVLCMNLITRLGRTLSLAGIAIAVAGTGALLAIVAPSGTSAPTAVLAPAMAVIGLGMGAAFGTLYDSIYFGALAGGQAHAMTVSLLAVIGIGVASALAVPLLPRKPQADPGH
jgi:hypothetical protein